jgi:DNA-binding NtrC family response regulator
MPGILDQNAASSPISASGREGIRILLVEDDEYYREAVAADLTDRGLVVHGFADATSLLDSLVVPRSEGASSSRYLPKASGTDTLGQLRQQACFPVVILMGLSHMKLWRRLNRERRLYRQSCGARYSVSRLSA